MWISKHSNSPIVLALVWQAFSFQSSFYSVISFQRLVILFVRPSHPPYFCLFTLYSYCHIELCCTLDWTLVERTRKYVVYLRVRSAERTPTCLRVRSLTYITRAIESVA